MYSILSAVCTWLRTHEQSLAIWLEGLALVAIFFLELKEYKRQGRERIEQHEETLKQMAIMQSQADAAKDTAVAAKANAEAARLSAQAVLNSERAWVEIKLGRPMQSDYADDAQGIGSDLFECSIQIENKGRTIAHIESVEVSADTVSGPYPKEPLNTDTKFLRSLLGSGETRTIIERFSADSAFSDGVSIVNGTHRGILRIVVKYQDILDASTFHKTSAVYVFQNSLEDEPERVSSLADYT